MDVNLITQFYVLNVLGTVFLSYFAFVFTRTNINNVFRLLLSGIFFILSSIFFAWAGDTYNGGIEVIFSGFKIVLSCILAVTCFFFMIYVSKVNKLERYRKQRKAS